MSERSVFDDEIVLPDERLAAKAATLIGFDDRYAQVRDRLRVLVNASDLEAWSRKYHADRLAMCRLIADQCPLMIYHGDVGTGKTVTAECVANRLVSEAKAGDSVLFKLSNRVRGSGRVGEMSTLLASAFEQIVTSAGKKRLSVLIIDEGDSLAASRDQDQSHHEDKVAVNTLIQRIDSLRAFHGRVMVFLCTNRFSALDTALLRRAVAIEEFRRPSDEERRKLFCADLSALSLTTSQLDMLVAATSSGDIRPPWTYSDIRMRLYPAALARAFPDRALAFDDLYEVAQTLTPTPDMEKAK